jgi:hypothetical protein
LGPKFLPIDKANATADSLENLFTPYDLCGEHHEWRVEARVQALLESKDNTQKLIKLSETKTPEELMVSRTNASGTFPGGPWFTSLIYLTTAFVCRIYHPLGGKLK